MTRAILDPDLPLSAAPADIAEALLVPPSGPERPQRCGAFAGGIPVPESTCFSGSASEPVSVFPDPVAPEMRLAGTWLFGGILSGHFGHMLCEGTGRLWALAGRQDIDGILFFARPFDKAARCQRMFASLGQLMGLPPARVLTAPTQVERLILPEQGLGSGELMSGRPESRAFLRERLEQVPAEGSGRRLYVSRMGQPARRGNILGEEGIESLFEAAGYEVVRPETMNLGAQVAMFRGASHVAGTEGSPFHLLAMAGQAGCRTAVIQRRRSPVFAQICTHLHHFLGAEPVGLDAVRSVHAPKQARNANLTYLEPSRPALSARLSEAGFLPAGTHWPDMNEEERQRDLDRLERETGHRLIRVAEPQK